MKTFLHSFNKTFKFLIFAALFLNINCDQGETRFAVSSKKNGAAGLYGDYPVYCLKGPLQLDDKQKPQDTKDEDKYKPIDKVENKLPSCTKCLLSDEMMNPDKFIYELKRTIKFNFAKGYYRAMASVKENKPQQYIEQFKHAEDFVNELEDLGMVRDEFYTVEKLQANLDSIQDVEDAGEQEKVQALKNLYQSLIDFMNNFFNPTFKVLINAQFSLEQINKMYVNDICSSDPNGEGKDPFTVYELKHEQYQEYVKSKLQKLKNKRTLVII